MTQPQTPVDRAAVLAMLRSELEARGVSIPDSRMTRRSFREYLRAYCSGGSWRWDWPHLDHLIGLLQAVADGRIRNLMVTMPPQHGKSECATVRFAAWLLHRDPATRVAIAAHSQDLADDLSRKCRSVAAHSGISVAGRDAVDHWVTDTETGGGLRAVGIGSSITGRPVDIGLIDDPIAKAEQARNRAIHDNQYSWYTREWLSRNISQQVMVTTRWADDDLAGRILQSPDADSWTVVNLPAIALDGDPLGRSAGESLCPDRVPLDVLLARRAMDPAGFETLYQGDPSPDAGRMIDPAWFRVVARREIPRLQRIAMGVDLAASAATRSDWTVALPVCLGVDGRLYLLRPLRVRAEWPEARRLIVRRALDCRAQVVGVESVAMGLASVQDLQSVPELSGVAVIGIKRPPGLRKEDLAAEWSPLAEDGRILLVDDGGPAWIPEFLSEIRAFPTGRHDDQVDAVSMAWRALRSGGADRPIDRFATSDAGVTPRLA